MPSKHSTHDPVWGEMMYLPAAAVSDGWTKLGQYLGAGAYTSSATDLLINAEAHALGDNALLMFFEGGEESEPRHVASSTADVITLGEVLSGTPSSGEGFVGLDSVADDACESTTTDTIIKATGHVAVPDDLFWMTSGGEIGEPRTVASVAATTITLDEALSGTPTAAETFSTATATVIAATVDSGTTDTVITDAAHVAVVGDLFMMTSGGEISELRVVTAVTAGASFTLNEALSGTPTAAETYNLYTPTLIADAEAGQGTTRLYDTAHGLVAGDQVIATNGGEDGEGYEIVSAGTDFFVLGTALSGTPAVAETYAAIRPIRQDANTGARWAHIHNGTNQIVDISFDGVTRHMSLLSLEEWFPPGANLNLNAIPRGRD